MKVIPKDFIDGPRGKIQKVKFKSDKRIKTLLCVFKRLTEDWEEIKKKKDKRNNVKEYKQIKIKIKNFLDEPCPKRNQQWQLFKKKLTIK